MGGLNLGVCGVRNQLGISGVMDVQFRHNIVLLLVVKISVLYLLPYKH